jgi:hypothetical protein
MAPNFIDSDVAGREGTLPKLPKDWPHGPLAPPERSRELVAREIAKHPPGSISQESHERLLNDSTLGYYFDQCVHRVLYRPTPEGPQVFAVGTDEIIAFRSGMSLEEQLTYKIWLPY